MVSHIKSPRRYCEFDPFVGSSGCLLSSCIWTFELALCMYEISVNDGYVSVSNEISSVSLFVATSVLGNSVFIKAVVISASVMVAHVGVPEVVSFPVCIKNLVCVVILLATDVSMPTESRASKDVPVDDARLGNCTPACTRIGAEAVLDLM